MGIKGGWNLLDSIETVSFIDWSLQKISTGLLHEPAPRIGVDASGWMFAAKYHHGQTKRRLFHLPIIPLFVFDGPGRPTNKHKKAVKKTPDWLAADFKKLLIGFGFPYWEAPGKAEAELAMLSHLGHIDAVMSEDFDTMVFSTWCVIRIKDESDAKYAIEVHEASQFSSNDLVLIALLVGGDYDEGIQGCGTQTAAEIIRTGIGKQLFDALEVSKVDNYPAVASAWHQGLCMMLEGEGAGHLSSRHHLLSSRIPSNFPKASVLIQYLHPVMSGLDGLPAAPSLGQPDLPRLAKTCEELFVWGHLMGIVKNFSYHVFPGLATRELLQDLYKRRGLNSQLSIPTVISKVCAIRANQHERAESEIFVSLIIPCATVMDITSVLDHEFHVWFSCILALHARPNILGDTDQIQIRKSAKRHKSTKPHLKNFEEGQDCIEISSDESDKDMTGGTH
ncbi:PIN domain-like protein [Armillaria mellea]|nr:PIN domain-like protein [Armillaria mellea]